MTDDELVSLARSAWRTRWGVELEASARFARLSQRLRAVGAARIVLVEAERASADETRHAALCERIARQLGDDGAAPRGEPSEVAPGDLGDRERVLYETVAMCCITETESVAVLTALLDVIGDGPMRSALHELARDEVRHGRLGWTHLAWERERGAVAFLGALLPGMLEGTIEPGFFAAADEAHDDERLLELGVLPRARHRALFEDTLCSVIVPGMDALGVDGAPAAAWLEDKRRSGLPANARIA